MGGQIAFATEADVTALKQAAQPVYASLEADPQTKSFIEQILAIKGNAAGSAADLPGACQPATATTRPPAGTEEFPEGVYRADMTPEFLIGQGMDSNSAYDVDGVSTLTFKDGTWSHHLEGDTVGCGGPYTVSDGQIEVRSDGLCGVGPAGWLIFSATWTVQDGGIRFANIQSDDGGTFPQIYWGSTTWTKIG
jgi:hypothetical protein